MADDILLNKVASIERCLTRIRQEYVGHEAVLETDYTRQDSIVLNLQRACETVIDIAMHEVRRRRLGLPQDSRDAFNLLEHSGIIPASVATRMQAMVGFRNIAVHQYQELDMAILRAILDTHLGDFTAYTHVLITSGHTAR
ncbi:MAG TPA: DUF86 domain-containing protein [Nevskiaceae bacterium]|nr:DUF86 domain-containing protein [Nevskiaceae bacterium]